MVLSTRHFSRKIIGWFFKRSIRQTDVVRLMRSLDLRFGLKGVIIRNDNGSQFIAYQVRHVLQALEAQQEFTHVATPEENAYIEAFHSIQQQELTNRFTFARYYHAKQHIKKYMYWYSNVRRHGPLKGITPEEKWAQGWSCYPVRQPNAWSSWTCQGRLIPSKNGQPISRSVLTLTSLLGRPTFAWPVSKSRTV